MKLSLVRTILRLLIVLFFLLILGFVFTNSKIWISLSIAVIILYGVVATRFWRCPECKQTLGRITGRKCPACGEELHFDR